MVAEQSGSVRLPSTVIHIGPGAIFTPSPRTWLSGGNVWSGLRFHAHHHQRHGRRAAALAQKIVEAPFVVTDAG